MEVAEIPTLPKALSKEDYIH